MLVLLFMMMMINQVYSHIQARPMASGTYGNNTGSSASNSCSPPRFPPKSVQSSSLIWSNSWIQIFPFSPHIPTCALWPWSCPTRCVVSCFSTLFFLLVLFSLWHMCRNLVENVLPTRCRVRMHSEGRLRCWICVGIHLICSARCVVEWEWLPACGWGGCIVVLRFLFFAVGCAA